MKKEIIQMQRLFEATEMTTPLGEHVQAHSLKMKRKNLVSLMKKSGIYSLPYGMLLAFFFLLKKIGIGLSVIQSAYLLLSILIAAATTISAGGVLAVKKYLIDANRTENRAMHSEAVTEALKITDKSPGTESVKASAGHNKKGYIYFQGFLSTKAESDLPKHATKALTSGFTRTSSGMGMKIGKEPCAAYMLLGFINMIDGRYHISIKLIETGTRRIIFASTEESDTADGVIDYAKKMGIELSGRNLF